MTTVRTTITTTGPEGTKAIDSHVQSDLADLSEAREYQQMFGEVLRDAGSKGHASGVFNVYVSLDGPDATGVGNSQRGFNTLEAANEYGLVLGRAVLDFHGDLLAEMREAGGAGPGTPQKARNRGRGRGGKGRRGG